MMQGRDGMLVTVPQQRSVPQQKSGRLHIACLDGLRGLSALYVVFFHITAYGQEKLLADRPLLNLLCFGHEAVVLFVVLSGFGIALPIARSPRLELRGGLVGFFGRRARRLLPAYYAALLMTPLYFATLQFLKHIIGEGADWTYIRKAFISVDMVLHLLLFQNFSSTRVIYDLNPVLWAVATMWWIYVVFALVLLPIWRRFGIFAATCVSIALGLLLAATRQLGLPTVGGWPHLLGAFGLGMASAVLLVVHGSILQRARWRTALGIVSALAFVVFCWIAIAVPAIRLNPDTRWITDLLIALACVAFILLVTSAATMEQPAFGLASAANRILEWRAFAQLGRFSYSLYLTHVAVWSILAITLGLTPVRRLVAISLDPLPMRVLIIPVLVMIAYGFYLLFEKPFLYRRK